MGVCNWHMVIPKLRVCMQMTTPTSLQMSYMGEKTSLYSAVVAGIVGPPLPACDPLVVG